jgi:hypothetical protein
MRQYERQPRCQLQVDHDPHLPSSWKNSAVFLFEAIAEHGPVLQAEVRCGPSTPTIFFAYVSACSSLIVSWVSA